MRRNTLTDISLACLETLALEFAPATGPDYFSSKNNSELTCLAGRLVEKILSSGSLANAPSVSERFRKSPHT